MSNMSNFPNTYTYNVLETEIKGALRVKSSEKVVKSFDVIVQDQEELERRQEHISDLPYFTMRLKKS